MSSPAADATVRVGTALLLLAVVWSTLVDAESSSPEVFRPFLARPRRSADAAAADDHHLLPAVDKRIGRMASWGRRDQLEGDDREKRIGRLATWGKKSQSPAWLDEATNKAIRSKWSSGSMSVWGKRTPPHDAELAEEEEEKRNKWNGNSMAVWGKRDEEKRGWENKNMALWG